MDDEARIDDELHSSQTTDDRRDQFTGAFFPGAQHFVVAGGNFRSVTNITQVSPDGPSDFRRIPMGDLDLRNEIRLDRFSGLVHSFPGRRSVRRVYAARIHGSKSKMTVAVYQGKNAEEDWREDVSRYLWLRHPNLVQLFATASSSGVHATIFHDELIPAQKLIDEYSSSHFNTVFLWNSLDTEFEEASQYSQAVLGSFLNSLDCTMWIRPSTGRLCVDLTANDDGSLDLYHLIQMASSSTAVSVLQPPEDSIIVDSLSLDGYHEICYFHLEHSRQLSISTKVSVQLGAVILCPPGSEVQLSNEIAYIPDPDVIESGWRVSTGASMIVLESGWTRVDSSEAPHAHISHENFLGNQSWHSKAWLAQANYIFHCLSITSKHNNYVLVHSINYILRLATSNSIPPGYLFLCPLANLQADSPSCFQLAECPAYWSLDPTGDERLSMVEAEQLGFPSFKLEMMVDGDSWAENVYTGIYQFHQAKGFDLDSQDVARELGLPIFEISTGLGSPFAHIQETDLCDRPETQEPLDTELPQEPVHGESGLHCLPLPLLASTSATAHQMNYFGVYAQGSAIDESFDPHLFGSSAPSTRHSQNFNNSNLNFEFPFRDQPYHLPPLEPSTLPQFITPPPSLWTYFPRLPPIPAPTPHPRPPSPIATHLDQFPASGSGKRKSRDDDPADDIDTHARRPRKMPKRADLWGV